MNNILTPPKQPAQQEAPMHRAAPAGANLTNARTGGMVAPRGYAEGTPSVPGPDNDARYLDPSANARGQLRLNSDGTLGGGYQPAVLSGQNWPGRNAPAGPTLTSEDWRNTLSNLHDAPNKAPVAPLGPIGLGSADPSYSPANAAGAAVRGVIPAVAGAVGGAFAPNQQISDVAGGAVNFARGLFGAPPTPKIPLNGHEARGMLDAALGAPSPAATSDATYPVDVYAHNPDTGVTSHKVYHVHRAPGDTSPAGTPDAQPMPYEEAPVGTPEHAVANPHAYSPEGFHAATGHLSLYQLGLMSQIAEQRARIGQMQATGQHAAMVKELVELGSHQHVSPAEAQRMGMLREGLGMSMKTTMPVEYDENGNVKQ